MAYLGKMSIRGIRAFSPDRDETIEFYSPLTMIVGANGCGKTTIIECLKYSCTGLLPPGARSGQSFINDPSMTESAEVKANIKLRFINRQNTPTVVVRSFQLTRKRTKMEFKALDGVVKMNDKNGEKVSLTHKCSELDKHVPDLLGVSRAIMENVVFCHQEESNWPLQEGALLKKKFDDIFESTRYSKALDAIAKSKKEFTMKHKDLQKDVAELSAYLHSANDMRESLAGNQQKELECREELEEVELSIDRTSEKLDAIKQQVQKIESMQQALQELEWQINELKKRIEEKKGSLETVFSESDSELKKQLENFDKIMEELTREFFQIQKHVDLCNSEINQLRSSQDDLNRKHGEMVLLEKQLLDHTAATYDNMKGFAKTYNLLSVHLNNLREGLAWDSNLARSFLKSSQEHADGLIGEMNRTLDGVRDTVRQSEAASMNAKSALQNLKLELSEKHRELERIESERTSIRRELNEGTSGGGRSSAKSQRAEAEADFNRANEELLSFQETANVKATRIKTQMVECTERLRAIDALLVQDDNALRELSLNRSEIERLNAIERQCDADNEVCRAEGEALLTKYGRSLPTHESTGLSNKLSSTTELSACLEDITRRIRKLKDTQTQMNSTMEASKKQVYQHVAAISADEKRRNELSSKLSSAGATYRSLETCLTDINVLRRDERYATGEVYRDLTASDPPAAIENALRALEDLMFEMQTVAKSAELWRNKIIRKASKNKSGGPVCPCCDRRMDNTEKAVFETKVIEIFNRYSEEQAAEMSRNLELFKALHLKALELLKTLRPFEEYKAEIGTLDARISSQNEALVRARADESASVQSLAPVAAELEALQQTLVSAQALLNRWTDVSHRLADAKTRKQRHETSVSQTLGTQSDNRSCQQIEDDRRSRAAEREDLQRKKDSLVDEDNRITKQFQSLRLLLSEAEKALLTAKGLEKRQEDLHSRLQELSHREERVLEETTTINRSITASDRAASSVEEALKADRDKLRKEETQIQSKILSIRGDIDILGRAISATEEQSKKISGKKSSSTIQEELDAVSLSIATKDELLREYNPKMNSINSQITRQEQVKRVVQENISYRSMIKELEAKTQEYADRRAAALKLDGVKGVGSGDDPSALGGKSLSDRKRELQRAEQEQQRLSDTRSKLTGRLSALREQTLEYEAKLNGPQFKSIDERHRRKNIECETTHMAVADLDAYFNALDRALLNFHTLKIKEVNKIIKELWQLIYRGEDIDNIEIVSGVEAAEGGAVTGGRADKSYNYRVVMRKGDSPMEMRGRCSAGQRVLASIVIRLALAETFCLNCGILALDEPTTNLDELNKMGLAHALARIISNRARQHNFQLICITHDEEFVRLMSHELSALSNFSLPEYYFRISREDRANTGVCQKCRLKVQWRFKYDKYKPLKQPASCSGCRKKSVTKAYRTLCDECAKVRNVCSGCCGELTAETDEVELSKDDAMALDEEVEGSQKRKVAPGGDASVRSTQERKLAATGDVSTSQNTAMDTDDVVAEASASSTLPPAAAVARDASMEWDARKFTTIASSKYDKSRVVGSSADTVFVFGEEPV